MFIAHSHFENTFLSGISSSGDRYYRAMELSGRLSWYIVTCVICDDGLEMLHSVCCSLEEDLLALLQPMPRTRAFCVQRVVASDTAYGRWGVRDICKVWQASTDEGKLVVVMQDEDGTEFFGPFGEVATGHFRKRNLIFQSQMTRLADVSAAPTTEPS